MSRSDRQRREGRTGRFAPDCEEGFATPFTCLVCRNAADPMTDKNVSAISTRIVSVAAC